MDVICMSHACSLSLIISFGSSRFLKLWYFALANQPRKLIDQLFISRWFLTLNPYVL